MAERLLGRGIGLVLGEPSAGHVDERWLVLWSDGDAVHHRAFELKVVEACAAKNKKRSANP